MTVKDPTVKEVIESMSSEQRNALYSLAEWALGKQRGKPPFVPKMDNENQQKVAYFLIGIIVQSKKYSDKIINDLGELLLGGSK